MVRITKGQEHTEEWQNPSSKEIVGLHKGLLDFHLGKVFSDEEAVSRNPYYILRRKLKKAYWRARRPFQSFIHRNCEMCKEHKAVIAKG